VSEISIVATVFACILSPHPNPLPEQRERERGYDANTVATIDIGE